MQIERERVIRAMEDAIPPLWIPVRVAFHWNTAEYVGLSTSPLFRVFGALSLLPVRTCFISVVPGWW